jgi:hypothetical protein
MLRSTLIPKLKLFKLIGMVNFNVLIIISNLMALNIELHSLILMNK